MAIPANQQALLTYAMWAIRQGQTDTAVANSLKARWPVLDFAEAAHFVGLGHRSIDAGAALGSLPPGSNVTAANPPTVGGGHNLTTDSLVIVKAVGGQESYLTLRLNLPWNITVQEYQSLSAASARELGADSFGMGADIEVEVLGFWVH